MSCLLYQCSEGDEFERNIDYVSVMKAKLSLANRIVSNLPEWQALAWE